MSESGSSKPQLNVQILTWASKFVITNNNLAHYTWITFNASPIPTPSKSVRDRTSCACTPSLHVSPTPPAGVSGSEHEYRQGFHPGAFAAGTRTVCGRNSFEYSSGGRTRWTPVRRHRSGPLFILCEVSPELIKGPGRKKLALISCKSRAH